MIGCVVNAEPDGPATGCVVNLSEAASDEILNASLFAENARYFAVILSPPANALPAQFLKTSIAESSTEDAVQPGPFS